MKPFKTTIWLEFLTITAIALLFSALFLADKDSLELVHLASEERLLALEHERLSGIMIPVELSLKADPPRLPTWNPYLGTGTPLVNDAFFYLFNPFMSVPMLALGAVQGTKVVIMLGVILAGYNMWALGKVIGLGGVARVMVASLYMLCGGIIGKYHNGHFQLALSLSWPPLVFAGLWWTLNSRHRLAPVLTAVAFTFLFFSGNIYYALHTLISGAVIVLAFVVPRFEWRRIRRVLIAGALALGLTMMQFLPVWFVRDHVSHHDADFNDNGQLVGQYELGQSITNFVMPWDKWSVFQNPPIYMWGAVDYAYIGPAVFAFISGLAVLALFHNRIHVDHRRAAAISLGLAVFMMIWGAAQTEIVQMLYRNISLLAEFRFLGRANSIAALWWILLAGIALDNLWRAARTATGVSDEFDTYDHARILRIIALAVAAWAWLLIYSLSDNMTRLNFAAQNAGLLNYMDERRFGNWIEAAESLVNIIAIALIVDTIMLIVHRGFLSPDRIFGQSLKRILATRLLRVVLAILAVVAINDVLYVNYRVIRFGPPGENFAPIYDVAKANDPSAPFPTIQEPWSPSAYDYYYNRIRNWGLNEGWVPLPMDNDLIPRSAPKLVNTPRWAIADNLSATNRGQTLAEAFVRANNGVMVECAAQEDNPAGQPCDPRVVGGLNLYEIPGALPYAFAVSEAALQTEADKLTGENTPAIPIDSHLMDEISLQATGPGSTPGRRDILVIQETNFPGWEVSIDGVKSEHYTVGTYTPGANQGGFIGIPMQSGTHTYTLRYEPPGLKLGMAISAVTFVMMLLYLAGVALPHEQPAPEVIPVMPPANPNPILPTEAPEPEPVSTLHRVPTRGIAVLFALILMGMIVIGTRLWNQK